MSPVGFTYSGISTSPREVSFEVEFHDPNGRDLFRAVQMQREMRFTLAEGQRWPDSMKRGRSIDIEINLGDRLYRLSGKVRFRRLNVAVVQGEIKGI